MKNAALMILASMILGQAAHAATVECSITRTNLYNDNDVATHSYSDWFDENDVSSQLLAAGEVESFLLPGHASVAYRFEVTGRGQTRLQLSTRDAYRNRGVACKESYGSLASPPDSVINEFEVGDYNYAVDCWIGM